jgi:group I intron endonuclease
MRTIDSTRDYIFSNLIISNEEKKRIPNLNKMSVISGLYSIKSKKTGKIYIGSSSDIILRLMSHCYSTKRYSRAYSSLIKDLSTQGKDWFEYTVEYVILDDAARDILEGVLIEQALQTGKCYNMRG